MDTLARLDARLAIQDCVASYARGVDRRDWELVRATYHPDAYDDHGPYKGDIEGYITWVSARHALVRQSMHFLGNFLVEFADDHRAVAETYWVALQRFGPEAGKARDMLLGPDADPDTLIDVETMGRYVDHFEKRPNAHGEMEWRVARRVVVFEGIKARPAPAIGFAPDWAVQRRDNTDPLYAARAAYGIT